MPNTITSDISRMLTAGLTDIYTENYDAYPVEYTAYVRAVKSTKQTEIYDSMGNLKAASEKTEGAPIQYGKAEQAYQTSITNKTWANGLSYSFESLKYDLYGALNDFRAAELANTMRVLEEEQAIVPINNATATNLADGVPLASNSKPLLHVPGQFNDTLATAASIGNPDNHQTMFNMFHAFKNHYNKPLPSYPTDALTYAGNQFTVEEMYKSVNKAAENSNTKNVLPQIAWHYLHYISDTNAWMMWDKRLTKGSPVVRQTFMGNTFSDEVDFDTKDYKFAVMSMWAVGALPVVGVVYNAGA